MSGWWLFSESLALHPLSNSNGNRKITHNLEPMLRDFAQFVRMLPHPGIDGWISLNRTGESEELAHDLS